MKSFEVNVNGKTICKAGLKSGKGVLTTHIVSVIGLDNQPDNLSLNVSGLNSIVQESLKWIVKDLVVGDEILVRIVESNEVDEPAVTPQALTMDEILSYKLKYYYQLKEELADHIKAAET